MVLSPHSVQWEEPNTPNSKEQVFSDFPHATNWRSEERVHVLGYCRDPSLFMTTSGNPLPEAYPDGGCAADDNFTPGCLVTGIAAEIGDSVHELIKVSLAGHSSNALDRPFS